MIPQKSTRRGFQRKKEGSYGGGSIQKWADNHFYVNQNAACVRCVGVTAGGTYRPSPLLGIQAMPQDETGLLPALSDFLVVFSSFSLTGG